MTDPGGDFFIMSNQGGFLAKPYSGGSIYPDHGEQAQRDQESKQTHQENSHPQELTPIDVGE